MARMGIDTWEKALGVMAGEVEKWKAIGEVPALGLVDLWVRDAPEVPQVFMRAILDLSGVVRTTSVARIVASTRGGDRLWTWFPDGTCYLGYVTVSRLRDHAIWGPTVLQFVEGDGIRYPTGDHVHDMDTLHPDGSVWSLEDKSAFLNGSCDIHAFLSLNTQPTRRWK